MLQRHGNIVGYIAQPPGTTEGDTDAERLHDAGVVDIRHEEDLKYRPVYHELIARCRGRDVLVVASLDRLGHPMTRLLRSVAGLCGRGIVLRCLDGGVNLGATQHGRAQVQLIDALVACLDVWEARQARQRSETMAERGSRPGAQSKLTATSPSDLVAMLDRPGANQTLVARELGVGRTTLYRHLKRTSGRG